MNILGTRALNILAIIHGNLRQTSNELAENPPH